MVPTPPGRRRAPASLLLVPLLAALACEAQAPPDGDADADGAEPGPPVVRAAFGLPGPWWRAGSSTEDFDADVRACREASTRARREAAGADPLDAAYRAFLACMESRGWSRGAPPPAQGS